jgi:type II secretory pathway component PulF
LEGASLPNECSRLLQYGEQHQCLVAAIERTIALLKLYQDVRMRLQQALFYPMTVGVAMSIFLCIVLFFVAPNIHSILSTEQWNSWFLRIQQRPFFGCCGVMAICLGGMAYIKRRAWDIFTGCFQLFRHQSSLQYSLFATFLSVHLCNGYTLKQGLNCVCAFIPNLWQQPTEGIRLNALPQLLQDIFLRSLDEMLHLLDQTSQFYWHVYQQRLMQALKWVEPLILLVLAVVLIMGILFALYPLFDTFSAMNTF